MDHLCTYTRKQCLSLQNCEISRVNLKKIEWRFGIESPPKNSFDILHLLCCAVLSHFSHVWLFATLWTVAHQAPLSMRIFQARILEWVAMPSSRGPSRPRDQTYASYVSCAAGRFFTTSATWEAQNKSYLSCRSRWVPCRTIVRSQHSVGKASSRG